MHGYYNRKDGVIRLRADVTTNGHKLVNADSHSLKCSNSIYTFSTIIFIFCFALSKLQIYADECIINETIHLHI